MSADYGLQAKSTSVLQQKKFKGLPFPLILTPSTEKNKDSLEWKLSEFLSWISNNKEENNNILRRHGAILFRGFPVHSASEFNKVVEAFGWEEFPYIGGAAPRRNIVGRVFTSNESPPDQKIPFHHEMAQVPEFPQRLFFYCDIPAKEEGETPLLLSHILAEKVQRSYPEFVKELRAKGLRYTRVLPDQDDPTSAIGRSWRSTFQTNDKLEAEKRGAKLGVQLDWQADGTVKTSTSVLPALMQDIVSGHDVWFNSMVAAYTGWKDSRNVPEKTVTFGDGSPLPAEAITGTQKIMDEIAVAVPWERGDVLLLDNILVQHARKTFVPPRQILAALTK